MIKNIYKKFINSLIISISLFQFSDFALAQKLPETTGEIVRPISPLEWVSTRVLSWILIPMALLVIVFFIARKIIKNRKNTK